jgi:osmoprotectant transport system permease protein
VTIRWDWIGGNLDEIAAATLAHLELTLIAVVVGFGLSLLLALGIYRWRRLYGPVAGIAGLLYTIPSLALFAVLVPFTGLSVLTAEIGLVSYTLLILVRGIVSGLDGVPSDAVEAATGMGYTNRQRLSRVELPLAIPVIVTSVRLATVTTIGLVMVTALIGEGGLGQLMLRGFNRGFPTMVYAGVVMSVVLAVTLDLGLVGLQRLLTPWARTRTA